MPKPLHTGLDGLNRHNPPHGRNRSHSNNGDKGNDHDPRLNSITGLPHAESPRFSMGPNEPNSENVDANGIAFSHGSYWDAQNYQINSQGKRIGHKHFPMDEYGDLWHQKVRVDWEGKRLRASCDACFFAKTKCDKQRLICGKCMTRGLECLYSASARANKAKKDPSKSPEERRAHKNNYRNQKNSKNYVVVTLPPQAEFGQLPLGQQLRMQSSSPQSFGQPGIFQHPMQQQFHSFHPQLVPTVQLNGNAPTPQNRPLTLPLRSGPAAAEQLHRPGIMLSPTFHQQGQVEQQQNHLQFMRAQGRTISDSWLQQHQHRQPHQHHHDEHQSITMPLHIHQQQHNDPDLMHMHLQQQQQDQHQMQRQVHMQLEQDNRQQQQQLQHHNGLSPRPFDPPTGLNPILSSSHPNRLSPFTSQFGQGQMGSSLSGNTNTRPSAVRSSSFGSSSPASSRSGMSPMTMRQPSVEDQAPMTPHEQSGAPTGFMDYPTPLINHEIGDSNAGTPPMTAGLELYQGITDIRSSAPVQQVSDRSVQGQQPHQGASIDISSNYALNNTAMDASWFQGAVYELSQNPFLGNQDFGFANSTILPTNEHLSNTLPPQQIASAMLPNALQQQSAPVHENPYTLNGSQGNNFISAPTEAKIDADWSPRTSETQQHHQAVATSAGSPFQVALEEPMQSSHPALLENVEPYASDFLQNIHQEPEDLSSFF